MLVGPLEVKIIIIWSLSPSWWYTRPNGPHRQGLQETTASHSALGADFLACILGLRPPASRTLPLWATGLWEEESGLTLLSLRSALLGPRHGQGISARVSVLHTSAQHLLHQKVGFPRIHSFLLPTTNKKEAAAEAHADVGPWQDGRLHGGAMGPFSDLLHT